MINLLRNKSFISLIVLISIFGIFLRLINYSKVPPFDVTKDEFFYPWSGMTFLRTGVPLGWSLFDAYPTGEIVYKWGTWYRIVSPWIEKPPLYPLLSGSWMIVNSVQDIFDVRLSTLRLLPIGLSFFTILFLGLFSNKLFGQKVALISTFLYASIPTIVMSNRLSLVENLLTPITLITLYFFLKYQESQKLRYFLVINVGCALALLTKNIGLALPLTIITYFYLNGKRKNLITLTIVSFIAFLIHPLIGAFYGFPQYLNVMKAYQETLALAGPPEVVSTIFRFPIVGHQWDKIFPDGPMLLGYILLLSSPFWLKKDVFQKNETQSIFALLEFPIIYIVSLALLESGATPYTFFGWHVYPLFPFLMILIAKLFYETWKNPAIDKITILFLTIGFSSVRFITLMFPDLLKSWQFILGSIFLIIISFHFLKIETSRRILTLFFILFLIVNYLVVINLVTIYPGFEQPLQ